MSAELVVGNIYSRPEIHQLVGGGDWVAYLPTKKNTVLAGCFDPDLNRRAPREIDVGRGDKILKRAKLLGNAKSIIPVFIKRSSNNWEYIGLYRCTAFSQEPRDINAYADRRKDAIGVLYFEESNVSTEEPVADTELLEFRAREGKAKLKLHFRRERSRDLIIAKRNEVRAEHGCLVCEACGVTEKSLPKSIGEACFEVHHKTPLSQLTSETHTRLADVSLICANCHKMIHRSEPMLTVQSLREKLRI